MSGPYRDIAGPGAVAAVNQALEEYGISGKGMKVEVLSADHLNKPDVGATVARQWFDRDGVDLILDVRITAWRSHWPVAKEKDRSRSTPARHVDLTGPSAPQHVHWGYDT